jgi:hypothetical protein
LIEHPKKVKLKSTQGSPNYKRASAFNSSQEYNSFYFDILSLYCLSGGIKNETLGRPGQEVSVLLEWRLGELCVPPEFRCKEAISLGQAVEGCLHNQTNKLQTAQNINNTFVKRHLQENMWGV